MNDFMKKRQVKFKIFYCNIQYQHYTKILKQEMYLRAY